MVVSGRGSSTGERDTSSRRHTGQGRYLLLMPGCGIFFKRMLRDGGPWNESPVRVPPILLHPPGKSVPKSIRALEECSAGDWEPCLRGS